MQRVIIQSQSTPRYQNQATRVQPGHGTGVQAKALNDEHYWTVRAVTKQVLSLLVNVIGGSMMILGMFLLPHIMENLI